jgi:hypothetical protein
VTRSIAERAALFFFALFAAGRFGADFFTAGRLAADFFGADFRTAGRLAAFAFDFFALFAPARDFDAPRAPEVLDADFARDFFFGPALRFFAFAAMTLLLGCGDRVYRA